MDCRNLFTLKGPFNNSELFDIQFSTNLAGSGMILEFSGGLPNLYPWVF